MKLCTFFGTFNPIHNAHIGLAQVVEKQFNFDKILFVPAFCPPHKTSDKKMAQHRLNMVKLALEKYNEFVQKISIAGKNEQGKEDTILLYKNTVHFAAPINELNLNCGYKGLVNKDGSYLIKLRRTKKPVDFAFELPIIREQIKEVILYNEIAKNIRYNSVNRKGG